MSFARFAYLVLIESGVPEEAKLAHKVGEVVKRRAGDLKKYVYDKTPPKWADEAEEFMDKHKKATGYGAMGVAGLGTLKAGGILQRRRDRRTAEVYRSYGTGFRR
jgi:uncharacterized protein (TIGR03382 family)